MKRFLLYLSSPCLALGLLATARPTPGAMDPVVEEGVPEGVSCGLGKEFHAGRRSAVLEAVEEGLLVFRGLPETRDYVPFHQDKVFWYLTGVESPGAALVMDRASGRQILFLPEVRAWEERWEGEKWDAADEWVSGLTGIAEVRPASELLEVIGQLAPDAGTIWISRHPHVGLAGCYDRARPFDVRRRKDPLDGRPSREQALAEQLEERLDVEVRDITPVLFELRRIKTPEEIEAIRRASLAGVEAMKEAMRSTRPGIGEWELDALMSFVHRRHGAAGPAYHAIVGSGPNSLVLHYSAVHRRLRAGEVVLIDYAPEVDHYTSDITRTWPVDGRFTPQMIELYDAVLAAQRAGIAAARPGVSLADVEGAISQTIKKSGLGHLMRHGSCHLVGLEVHDVGRTRLPLEVGVTFTIEPGLYDPETGIGVRIEDVVVITEDGCENLSRGAPRERAEIEALISERGLLERMDD